ncbi:MAG: glycoside hydrolase family 16 protein [Eubacterium sp.]|nr:glycoside hydrolase family 16 protein [Eubacterium sp.]
MLKKKILSILMATILTITGLQIINLSDSDKVLAVDSDWELVWSDEFEGDSLDTDVWCYDVGIGPEGNGWGNEEIQYYTDRTDNVSVSDGELKITAKKEQYENRNYTSGRITTWKKKSFQYGKMEARIKVEGGNQKGVWPAFWMMGHDYSDGTTDEGIIWPSCGELDIMEHANDRNYTEGTIHWRRGGVGPIKDNHEYWGSYSNGEYYYFDNNEENGINGWHTYGVIWDEDKIQWYVDDNVYLVAYLNEGNKYAFQKEHFFLFNLALGGPGTGYTGNTTVDDNFQSATMHVDYVRVYQGGSTEIETTTREIVSPDGDFSGLTYKASNNNQDLSVAFYEGKTDDEVNYCLDQGDKFYVATWGKKVKPQFKRVECNGDVQESPSPGANFWIPMSALKKNAYNLVTVQDNNENEFHFVIKYGTPSVVETTTPEVTTPETTTLEVTTPEETTTPAQITNKEINLLGYQISTSYEGVRVAANVEPVIDGQQVKKWGFIYGLKNYGNKDTGITDDDMYVGTTNSYVKSYESTSAGTLQSQLGDSATATYFARTMKFGGSTVTALTADYKVRAYAVLADGSYAYSDVSDYSIAKVADKLYQGKLMNTKSSHSYLYENILSKVFKDYEEVDFIWNNTVVKPEEVED